MSAKIFIRLYCDGYTLCTCCMKKIRIDVPVKSLDDLKNFNEARHKILKRAAEEGWTLDTVGVKAYCPKCARERGL